MKMAKQFKRLYSFLLALIMVLSMIPGNAFEVFATDGTATVAEENTSPSWALAKCPHCDKTIAQIDEEGGWTSWNGGGLSEATGYHYRLSKNSTSTWSFGSKTLFIDLNGKSVNCKNRLGVAGGGSNITFVDSSATSANPAGDSVIVGGNSSSGYNTSGLMVYGGNGTVADATVKIYGGNWTQAQAEGESASNAFFYVLRKESKKSTLEIYGGRVYNCWNETTGAIQSSAGCSVLIGGNAVIEGNRTTEGTGANIYISGGTLTIQDNAVIQGGISSKGTVTLKGTPTIDKSSSETYVPTWSLRSSGKVNVSEMTGGKVYVSYSSTYKTSFSGDGAALVRNGNLVCEQENYILAPNYEGVPVVTSRIYCVKGHTSHEGETANCEWPLMGWLNWTSTTSLPTRGHYQLENSVTEDSMTTSKDELYLNLNGQNITKTISGNGKTSTVLKAQHKVTLTDTSAQPGTVTVAPAENVQYVTCYGTVLYATGAAAQLNIHGGIYDGSPLYYYRADGTTANAAVMAGTSASVNVYGGRIIGHKRCTVEGYTVDTKGSALGGWGGTHISIYGGEIIGGSAANGATIGTTGDLTILGGTIVSGSVKTTGKGIHVAGEERTLIIGGDAVIEDIYIGALKSFEMHGAPQIEDLQIGSAFETTIDATKLTTGEDGAKITVRLVSNSTRAFARIADVAQRDCFQAKSNDHHIAYNAEDSTVNLCANNFAQTDAGNGTHIETCQTCGLTKGEAAEHTCENWSAVEENNNHAGTCSVCNAKMTGNHQYGEYIKDENGHKLVCAICNNEVSGKHEFSKWAAVENTNKHTHSCSVCGYTETTEHEFKDYTSNGDAKCEQNGTETGTCTCGATHTREEENSALKHSFTKYASQNDATCTADGHLIASCDNNCGATDKKTDAGSMLQHKFVEYKYNNDAKCGVNGTKTASCEYGCGATNKVTAEGTALEHVFTNYVSNNDAVCGTDGTKTAKCDREGCNVTNTVTDEGSALQHKFVEYKYNNDATCTENGTETATCANADCSQTDTREAVNTKQGHEFGEYAYNGDATCAADGTETAKCVRCPETKTQKAAGTKLTHSFTNYVSNNDAKCEEDGTKTASCDHGCGTKDTQTDVGSKRGHSFTNYASNNDATCLADGTKTAKCDRCDKTDTLADKGSKLGHSFKDYVSNNDAKCEEDGTETAKCERCEVTDTRTDEGSAKTHTYTNYTSNGDATCEKDGTKTASCDHGCGTKDTQTDAGSKLEHSFTNYVSNNDATCEKDGTKTASCDYGCGEKDTKSDVGSKLEHDWTATPVNNGDDHTITCKNGCGETKTEAHDFTDGDCVCGAKEVVELPAIVAVLTAVSGNGPVTEMTGFTSLAELAKEMENYSQLIVWFGEVPQFDVTLNADLAETEDVVLEYNTNLHLNGHTFQGTIVLAAEDIVLTGAEGLDVKTTVTDGEVVFENGVHKVVTKTYVAEVDGVEYETLAAAIAAANGKTVKLLENVELTETLKIPYGTTMVLDLNGKTISQVKNQTTGYSMIENDGVLTIMTSQVGGKISYTDSGNGGNYVSNTITNRGTITVQSGTIENLSSKTVGNNGYPYVIDSSIWGQADKVETNITGGKLYSEGYSAIRLRADSATEAVDVNVTGGEIVGTIEVQLPSGSVAGKGTLNITGGQIKNNATSNALFVFGSNGTASNLDVNISGGNITGNVTVRDSVGADFDKGIITGGTFTTDVTALCAEGFEAKQNADGTYGVVEKKTYVAMIGEQGYESLQAAIENAATGAEVVILAEEIVFDENAASIVIDKSITIKGAGADKTKLVFNSATSAFTISASNVTFADMTIEQGTKDNSFGISVNKGAWNAPAVQYSDITIKNVAFVGGDYALCVIGEDVVIDGCTFDEQDSHNILVYSLKGDSKITNNIFNASKGSNKSAILFEGGADNATDLSNFIGGGKLTIDGNEANDKGVFFQFTNWALIEGMELVITNNKVDAFTNKAIALYTTDPAAATGNEFSSITVKWNVFTNVPSGRTILKEYTGKVEVDASANYLGSETPDVEALMAGDKVTVDSYYSDEALTKLVETAKTYVAMIGEQGYESLQAALNAVEEGQTIKLLCDVNITTPAYGQNALNYTKAVNCIIDLDGKTLSANTGNSVFRFNITQSGATSDVTVTLKNGKIVAGSSTWCTVMNAGLSADVKAVFELEDLIIESSKAGDLAVKAWDFGLIKAKNVTVNATNGAGGFYAVGGEIVLDNCTVNQKGLHTAPYLSMALAVSTGGKITVNSGSYTSEPTAAAEGSNQGTSHGSWTAGVMNSGGELIINGGTFTNGNFGEDSLATAARGLIFADTKGIVTVNDGTFNALKSVFDFQNNLGGTSPVITVKGGKYSADPAKVTSYGSIVIAEGFAATQDADGYYTLKRVLVGSGTEANPFLIKSLEDLILFRDSVNAGETKYNADGVYVALAADIDMTGADWSVNIGDDCNATFDGIFDGKDHVISNLTSTETAKKADGYICTGLFGAIAGNAQIKNLTIKDATINVGEFPGNNVSAVVGFAWQATGSIENVKVEGLTINAANATGVGAILGYDYYSPALTVENCSVTDATINGKAYVGGVVGYASTKIVISGCEVEDANITGTASVAGIAGILAAGGKVENATVKSVDVSATGELWANSAAIVAGTITKAGSVTISGTTYEDVNVTAIAGGALVEKPTAPIEKVAAKIGNTYYATFDAAMAAAVAGDKIEVFTTIVVAKGETKEINLPEGVTVSMVTSDDKMTALILNNGNLTITGSGKLSYKYTGTDQSDAHNTIESAPGSVLTVNGGTIENLSENCLIAYAIDGLTNTNADNVVVNINGGTITSKKIAVRIFANSTQGTGYLNITGGDIYGRVIIQNASAKANKAELSITGGTFNTNGYKSDVLYVGGSNGATGDITASVAGGTFNGEILNASANDNFISGGTFATDVSEFCVEGYKAQQNADGTYGVVVDPVYGKVAKIGDTYYADLHEAMVAAKSGETVELIADVDLAGTEWEPVSFAGKFNGNNFTIKNLTINKPGVSNTGFIKSLNGTFENVTFENVTVIGGECTGVVAGRAGGSSALAQNITVTGTIQVETTHSGYARAGVIVGGWAYGNYKNITVDGVDKDVSYIKHSGSGDGRYVAGIVGHADDVDSYINCTVTNITISGGWLCGGIAGPGPSDGLIEGCVVENVNINADYSGGMFGWSFGNGTIKDSTVKDVAFVGGTANNGAIGGYGYNADATVENVTIENVTNGGKALLEHVAEVDGAYYFDLQAAIDAAVAGETVKLLKNVEIADTLKVKADDEIVLDLNGKTISQSKACTASYEMISNKGKLTITGDGKISLTDTGAGDSSFGWGSYTIRNEGTLVVENGTVEFTGAQAFGTHCSLAIFQYSGSTVINGGKIINNSYRSLRLWKGDVTINGGEFQGQVWVHCVDDSAKLTINGGSFAPAVNGGDGSSVFVNNSGKTAELSVTGGTFATKIGANDTAALAGAITGGQFSESAKNNTSAAMLSEGLVFAGEANAAGYYELERGLKGTGTETDPYLIKSLEDLILFRDSVNAGETKYNADGVYVALAADIDMTGADWSVNIGDDCNATFDGIFDGKNFTISNLTSTETAKKADGYICTGLFGAIAGNAQIKNLTIKDATINVGEFPGNNVSAVVGFAWQATGSIENVKVEGLTINAANATGVGAILGYDYYSPALTVENCSVTDATINGKSYVGGVVGYASTKIVISDCKVEDANITGTGSVAGIAGILVAGGKVENATVKSVNVSATGELWANSAAIVAGTITKAGSVTISGTTYEDVNVTAIAGGALVEKPTAPIEKVAAKIGDTYYATFASAYAAAEAGETVTLLQPIVVAKGETLTLDKAVTISYTSNVAGEDMITNRGTLIVDGATLVYVNTDATASNVTVSTISSEAGSVLEIKSGVVKNDSANNASQGIYAYAIDLLTNGNMGDVTATISGGEVISTNYMAIRQFNNGTACANSLTISGGEIYGAKRAIQIHIDNNAAELAISGGKIEAGEGGYALCLFPTTSTNIAVSGGEFKGAIYSGTDAFISGGIFDTPVYEGYCAEGYIPVENADGTYGVKIGAYVAQIGTKKFETLAEALTAAQNGETIELIWAQGDAPIAMNGAVYGKTVTITGTAQVDWSKGFLFVGRGGEGNGTVIFDNAQLTSASNNASYGIHVSGREKNTTNKYDGTLVIKNSNIELDYLINKGAITMDNSTLTVKNGFAVGGRPASETESGADATATIDVNNGSKLIVNNHNGMGLGYEAIGVMNVDATSTFECTQSFLVTAKGTMNIAGTAKVAQTLTNNGVIKMVEGASLSANEGLNITIDEGYKLVYADGTYTVKKLPVAKVGNTEYTTIEEAIAAWANGTTLTLLSDVTLSDVILLKSTEHHILNLGTYTMTAASGKNAIEITCEGRSSASYALTVNADAQNPGGITATGKACIYYKKSGTTKDRPIILINNGVFNGSYSINSISNGNTNCPQIWINGGTFNGNVNLTKNMLKVSGGTFNGWVNCTGDSSAYRQISGGTFKSWQFMTADADNKFWVGTAKATYDVGVYVDNNGYLVVGGPVITAPGTEFVASSTNYSGWSSYLKYSSAAANQLYYTSLTEALADNNKTTGAVTIYTDNIDLTGNTYKGALVLTEGDNELTVTFAEGATPAWSVKSAADGMIVTYTDSVDNGVVTRTYRVTEAVAQVGEKKFASLQEAIDAAVAGDTIELLKDCTENVTVTQKDGLDLVIDGKGYTYNGKITVKGRNNDGAEETLTIKNINFASDTAKLVFIDATKNKVQNLTVQNCTFTSTAVGSTNDIVAVKTTQAGNVTVKDCVGNNVYYLVYNTSGGRNLVVDGCTLNDGFYGIRVHNNIDAVIKNCELNTEVHAIVLDGGNSAVTTIENCEISVSRADRYPVYFNNITGNRTLIVKGTNDFNRPNGDWVAGTSAGEIKVVVEDANLTLTTGMAAKIGNTYYNTLQYAFEEAVDGDTITMVEDHTINSSATTTLGGKYNTLIRVAGESITLDLNGKKIYTEYSGTNLLVGVFSTEQGGQLTLTDSSAAQTGTVEAKSTGKLYALLVNYDSTAHMTVEAGNYILDNASDSLIYTGGNEGVVVNGGYFHLGNVGTGANGMPWIFNASGQNTAHVIVTGGTFNADVAHQYWEFEVSIPYEKAVVDNGDGTWSIAEAVAYVAEESTSSTGYTNYVGYATLQEAIDAAEAGEKVVLLKDVGITNTLKVNADDEIILDLNGKTINGLEAVRIAIMSYGDLTLMDSSAEQTGIVKAGIGTAGNAVNICGGTFTMESGSIYSKNNAILVDEQAATINITGGTITAEPNTKNSAVMYVSSTSNTEINISGGELKGYNGLLLWNNNVVNMTSGSIEATGSAGIQGNGTCDNTEINISGDASVSGYYTAIYHPQNGKLNISDNATLTGWTGVVIKSGTVNISGGTISGTGAANTYRPVSSGYVDTGDGLYVEHYDNSSNSANYGTPNVSVTGGTFTSANASAVASYVNTNNNIEKLTGFITGGTFNTDVPQELCAWNYRDIENGDGTYTVVEKFLEGSGTEADPFLIKTLDDLNFFRDSVNCGETRYNAPGVWVALDADIDMAGTVWTEGIGDGHNWSFDGCFDGKNYTISNLTMTPYVDNGGYICGGLFGYIYAGAKIRNLTIENATITTNAAGHNVGVLVGFAYKDADAAIENVTLKGDIIVDAPNAYGVGGILGYSYYTDVAISNCKVEANDGSYIKGYSFVGGINGYTAPGSTITDCSVKNMDITATSCGAGGITGLFQTATGISGCAVENVTTTAQANAGSIIGSLAVKSVTLTGCTAAEPKVGGSYETNKKVAAKIGDTYYLNLQDAVDAAVANDTIVLLSDGELATAAVIPGVTVDLNGNTLKGDLVGTLMMNGGYYITAQDFAMAGPDASLYLTDDAVIEIASMSEITVKSGSIELGQSWRTLAGQTLTIASGASFEIPTGMTMEVSCDVIVEGTLTVNGELVLTDLDATVKAVENLNVTSGVTGYRAEYEDGVYFLYDDVNVAINVATGEKYADLQAAINAAAAGVTVQLMNDVNLPTGMVIMMPNVTLDLNGYTLKAFYFIGAVENAHVIDSGNGEGLLVATTALFNRSNEYLAIAIDGGYRFAKVKFGQGLTKLSDGSYRFQVRLSKNSMTADDYLVQLLNADGVTASDYKLQWRVKVSWTDDNGAIHSQRFAFSNDIINEYIAQFAAGATNTTMNMTVTGAENLKDLTFTAQLVSLSNVNDDDSAIVIYNGTPKSANP